MKSEQLKISGINAGVSGEYFIVPSKKVAKFVEKNYADWLVTPGRNGQKHNDTTMRQFHDPKGSYLERWDLLELDN